MANRLNKLESQLKTTKANLRTAEAKANGIKKQLEGAKRRRDGLKAQVKLATDAVKVAVEKAEEAKGLLRSVRDEARHQLKEFMNDPELLSIAREEGAIVITEAHAICGEADDELVKTNIALEQAKSLLNQAENVLAGHQKAHRRALERVAREKTYVAQIEDDIKSLKCRSVSVTAK